MKKLGILATIFTLAMACGAALPQSAPHSVTIKTTATAPGTATVLRASGSCPTTGVPNSGTTLTSTLSVPTPGTAVPYNDATVVDGNTYCYLVTFAASGGGSAVSNTFQGSITVSVTISGSVQ